MATGADRANSLGPDFASLLTAAFITNLGDGLRLTALPLLAATLTSSPLLISGVVAAQFLPWTTFAPFGGVIVDRSDRRRLIMITQTWRSLVMAALFVLVMTDAVEIWHLFVVTFVITVGEILVDPSVVATLPTLVAPADLDRANGRISTVETVTNEFVGGPLGAALFGFAPWLPFIIDAVTYLGSVGPFSRLPSAGKPVADQPHRSLRTELGEGLRWIRGHAFLWPVTVATAMFHLGTAGAFSLLILVVTDLLDAPPIIFGLALTASAIGATFATMVAARLADRFSRRIVITSAAAVTALSVIAIGGVRTEWQLVLAWALNGAGGGVMLSIGRGFIQRHTPNDRLGRSAIASRMITRTSFVIGALLAGTIATSTSVRWAYVIAGACHLLGTVLLWRAFRHEPD